MKFEINFNLPTYSNPYDPSIIDCYALFISPSGKTYKQNGFFYQGFNKMDNGQSTSYEILSQNSNSGWKIRFSPNEVGNWKFRIVANNFYYPSSITYSTATVISSNSLGFIKARNTKYLEYSTGVPYYPIGNSYPWFKRNTWRGPQEFGTNEIVDYENVMVQNKMNFFRFEINYLEGLNLIGYDFTTSKNYHKYYNQKDSWQLDKIIENAENLKINLLLAVFSHADLGNDHYCNNAWDQYNAYSANVQYPPVLPDSKGMLLSPYDWYSSEYAKTQQKNLLRYIIARWGYSTSVLGLELMDEADRIEAFNSAYPMPSNYNTSIVSWHIEMYNYIKQIDPFKHLITTAFANMNHISSTVYNTLDFAQIHRYVDYATWNSIENIEDYYFSDINSYYNIYKKPVMHGEMDYFNFEDGHSLYDPHFYGLHNILWSSLYNGSLAPCSLWTGMSTTEFSSNDVYIGVSNYSKNLPQWSEVHIPEVRTVSNHKISLIKDNNTDEYYGCIQDLNFSLRNLYNNYPQYLVNFSPSSKPSFSAAFNFNLGVLRNGLYEIQWYNTETGQLFSTQQASVSNLVLTLNVSNDYKNAKYADLAFIVRYVCTGKWNAIALNEFSTKNSRLNSKTVVTKNGQVVYIGVDNKLRLIYKSTDFWQDAVMNVNAFPNVRYDSDLAIYNNTTTTNIYFIGTDNRIHLMYWNNTYWEETTLNGSSPQNVKAGSSLTVDKSGKVYFVGTDNRIHTMYWNGSIWQDAVLNSSAPQNVRNNSPIVCNSLSNVFFIGTDDRIHIMYWNNTYWQESTLNTSAPQNVNIISELSVNYNDNVLFTGSDNRIHIMYWNNTYWQEAVLNANAPQNVKLGSDIVCDNIGKVYYIATDNKIHHYYYNTSYWQEAINSNYDLPNVNSGLSILGSDVFYISTSKSIWTSYYGCNSQYKVNEIDNNISCIEESKSEYIIYPNPAKDVLYIKNIKDADILELKIYDMFGKVVKSCNVENENFNLHLDIPSGNYVVELISVGKTIKSKLIIE